MRKALFGEVLRRLVHLSELDVEEILNEQQHNHRPFGQIAVTWGLCEHRDVWNAWFKQLGGVVPQVDIDQIGVDSQALAYVPREMACKFKLIPLRAFDDQLVLAVAGTAGDEALPTGIVGGSPRNVHLVRADARQIEKAIEDCYGLPASVAAAAG